LGLPISRRLTEAHGGRLWLESVPGEGASFYVSLLVRSEALQPTIKRRVQMSNDPFFLYIEDDPTSREVMEMILVYRMGFSRYQAFEIVTILSKKSKAYPKSLTSFFLTSICNP